MIVECKNKCFPFQDLLRGWIKENPVKERHLKEGTPVKALLDQQPQVLANFELHPEANPKSREQGLLRWQMNPNRYDHVDNI